MGTIGLIVATLSAGWLWDLGRAWPFGFFVVGSTVCLVLGLALYRFGGGARAVQAAAQAVRGSPSPQVLCMTRYPVAAWAAWPSSWRAA